MATMKEIEALARVYAEKRAALAGTVSGLNDEINQVKNKYLATIKRQVGTVKDHESNLRAALENSIALFAKPRTVTINGVKVGFAKGKGKVIFADADKVVELIEKHLEEQAELLVLTEKKPNKEAIAQLDVADLKRIGCQVVGTGDQVVIKDTASDVDKLVSALLKEDEEDE